MDADSVGEYFFLKLVIVIVLLGLMAVSFGLVAFESKSKSERYLGASLSCVCALVAGSLIYSPEPWVKAGMLRAVQELMDKFLQYF